MRQRSLAANGKSPHHSTFCEFFQLLETFYSLVARAGVSEDLQKVWRDFLVSYAKALKAKHELPIEVKDVVRTV